jgi:hypothetical protein
MSRNALSNSPLRSAEVIALTGPFAACPSMVDRSITTARGGPKLFQENTHIIGFEAMLSTTISRLYTSGGTASIVI